MRPVTAECVELLKGYPSNVIPDVVPDDPMYAGAFVEDKERAYVAHGRAMLDVIRLGMVAARMPTASRILDLPSGRGRALRWLKAEYPDAEITACDIDRQAVEFCAEKLGAIPVYGKERPADINLGSYDLIWCGSLLTHLDAPAWDEFLDLFESALDDKGLLMFSFSGRSIAEAIAGDRGPSFMPDAFKRAEILQGYEQGFGFADYDQIADFEPSRYGISLAQPQWVLAKLFPRNLQLVTYLECRWGGQDIIGAIRVDGFTAKDNPFRGPTGGRLDATG